MDGREEEYQWAGPYLYSRQVVAVRSDSDIRTLQDLAGKVVAVQSTTKPEELFLNAEQNGLPRLRRLYSCLLYTSPHQLARLVLTEQIYRACTINAGMKYHK